MKKLVYEVDVAKILWIQRNYNNLLCGVVGGILSMKKGMSASYFDGEMSDGKAKDWV